MKPRILCHVIILEMTQMLGDRRVGMHRGDCDLIRPVETVKLNNLLIIMCSLCVVEI